MTDLELIYISGTFYRSNRPITMWDLSIYGIRYVISLNVETSNFHDEYYTEEFEHPKFRIGHWQIKLKKLWPPNRAKVRRCLSIIAEASRHEQAAYIDCLSEPARAAFIIAAHRMQYDGWSFDRAYAEWKLSRPWYFYWWRFELKKWIKS